MYLLFGLIIGVTLMLRAMVTRREYAKSRKRFGYGVVRGSVNIRDLRNISE